MKFKGHGITWDAENNHILCQFENGEFKTTDERIIEILKNGGYEIEEEAESDETDLSKLKNDELKALLDKKGIGYDAKAKKEELIKLLEGAE